MSKETENCLEEFTTTLEVLTFNSKPIIDELTKFAEAHKKSLAKFIAEAIEDRVLEVEIEHLALIFICAIIEITSCVLL